MEHDSFPVSVLVHVGDHQVPATAHGRRAGPHGDQTLVCIDGHYVWVCSTKVTGVPMPSGRRADYSLPSLP